MAESDNTVDTLVDHQAALQSQVNDLSTQIMMLGLSIFCVSLALALVMLKASKNV
jgi:hypothetical protein